MRVIRIKSDSMRSALDEAMRQLGEGVTVLHTKQYEDSALFGLSRKPVVEILAAVDAAQPVSGFERSGNPETPDTGAPEKRHQDAALQSPEMRTLTREMADIRKILGRLDAKRDSAQLDLSPATERLLRNGVSPQLAQAIVQEAGSDDASSVAAAIRRRVRCSGPIACDRGQARVALVGPTGAGKTTTAAKLAAHFALTEGKSVALLTIDTYRVGAVEQLGAYARILKAPLEVGMCAEDVEAVVRKHSDRDVIIIDTVGRSQRDGSSLDELALLLRQASPTEVHLTVSAQASPAAQKEAVDAFRRLRADRLVLTKLDECPQAGVIVDLAVAGLLPFSYITFGQEVPDDIAIADEERLSRLVWEGSL